MERQTEALHTSLSLRRIFSVILATIICLATLALPVNATTAEDLDATYGTKIQTAVKGTLHYEIAYEIVDLVNAERAKVGKSALALDKTMLEAAMLRAAESALYYNHIRPTGESCFTAFVKQKSAGENLAAGFHDAKKVMEGWMNSPHHKANILDENNYNYRSIGIGVFEMDGVLYWVQLFNGKAKQSTPTQKKPVTKTISVEARTDLLDLSCNYDSLNMNDGDTANLIVYNRNVAFPYVDHQLSTDGLTYVSDDTHVAKVSSTGRVTAVSGGSTTVHVQDANGVNLFSIPVHVTSTKVEAYISATKAGTTKVVWSKVEGATTYRVYKSVYEDGKWSKYTLFKHTKSLYCVDTTHASGQKAKYAVYAYVGNKRFASHDTVVNIHLCRPSIQVTSTTNGGKVSWKKVEGATYYKVYRSTYSGGKWSAYKLYKTTASLSYTDTHLKTGQQVRYAVCAYNGSYHSPTTTCSTTTYLARPNVKLAKATKGVKVSWNKIGGAGFYRVYRSVYKNGKWTDYTYYKATKTTSYTDNTIQSGQRVRYTVYAVCNGCGKCKSAYKTGVSITR